MHLIIKNHQAISLLLFGLFSYATSEENNNKKDKSSSSSSSKEWTGGLRCYVCNSARDPRCGDPFSPGTIELTECAQFMPNVNATVCRKNVQRISLGDRIDNRIIRTCGFDNEGGRILTAEEEEKEGAKNVVQSAGGKCFKRSGTFEVMVTYCSCNHDSCNTATKSSFQQNQLINLMIIFFPLILRFYY